LETLAYFFVELVAGIFVHSAGRQQNGFGVFGLCRAGDFDFDVGVNVFITIHFGVDGGLSGRFGGIQNKKELFGSFNACFGDGLCGCSVF